MHHLFIEFPNEISRLHWIELNWTTNIESHFAIDTNTRKHQFTHEIVCFWCINSISVAPHAVHILPLDLISILLVSRHYIPATIAIATAAATAADAVVNDIVENALSIPMCRWHTKCSACQLKYNDFDCILLILNESWHRCMHSSIQPSIHASWFVSFRFTAAQDSVNWFSD